MQNEFRALWLQNLTNPQIIIINLRHSSPPSLTLYGSKQNVFSCCLINNLIVKFLVLLGHVEKELAGSECRAVVLLESAHMIHKFTSSHGVGVSKRLNILKEVSFRFSILELNSDQNIFTKTII